MNFTMKYSVKKLLAGAVAGILLLSATFTSAFAATTTFTDVKSSDWYYSAVVRVNQAGVMDGVGGSKFNPNGVLTREQFVTVLGKQEKIDASRYADVDINAIFSDVPNGAWYSSYIAWAYESGVTSGVGNGLFGLGQSVSREQMAKFMVNYCQLKQITLPTNAVSDFKDESSIHAWAKEAADLCHQAGIFNGDANGYFSPLSSATRSVTAQVFCNFLDVLDGVDPSITPSETPSVTPEPTTPSLDANRTVYVSNSHKIHSVSDCSGMKHYTEMTLAEAQAKGYELCSNCW